MTALYRQHGELFTDCTEFYVKCILYGGSISDCSQILRICMLFAVPLGTNGEMPNFLNFGSSVF